MPDEKSDAVPGGTVSVSRHERIYRRNRYVYPVLSRRARGISIGINLNPDKTEEDDVRHSSVRKFKPQE